MGEVAESEECSYCGLPTKVRARESAISSKVYCCLGCRIASGMMSDEGSLDVNRQMLTRLGMAIFFTMNVMVFTLVLWTWNVHEFAADSQILAFREVLRYGCMLFSAPVLILLGGPLLTDCWEAWRRRQFTTDALLFLGVCAAFGYSVVSLLLGFSDVYFEVACMILVAVTLGKWLEATAKHNASRAIRSMRRLLPEAVRVIHNENGDSSEVMVDLASVQRGDVLRVVAGERIPVDGLIESNSCVVDEQLMTGESLPKTKYLGEEVFGGTLNLASELRLRATKSSNEGAISRLMEAVVDATSAKCHTIRVADRLAAWFVPIIGVASAVAFILHFDLGPHHALMAAISVVLIACPCALGIATPLAVWVAVNSAARRGVLFRNGDAVANLARVRSIAFDKTGTITTGNPHVDDVKYENSLESDRILRIAHGLATSSNHVLARAVKNHVVNELNIGIQSNSFSNQREIPGKGVTGQLHSERAAFEHQTLDVMFGSYQFAMEMGLAISPKLIAEMESSPEHSVACLGIDGRVEAVFFFGEQLRTELISVFRRLREVPLQLYILTGDRADRAALIESVTEVPTTGELLPEGKAAELDKLPSPVAMVGDGINDALALTTADVGIALDCGADVSRDTADICLMSGSLEPLPWAISMARATRIAIHRNLFWAVAYNAVGIGIAVSGKLNPIMAAIAMVGSSLFVLTNSLNLAALAETDEHVIDEPIMSGNTEVESVGVQEYSIRTDLRDTTTPLKGALR